MRRMECMVSKMARQLVNIAADGASSDSDSVGMLAFDDCAGSDTEKVLSFPFAPRLLQLHDVAGPKALALAGTACHHPLELKDACAFGPPPAVEALGDLPASSVAMSLCSKSSLVICGAGISTASGIQDFRSSGGLYDTFDLRENGLLRPEALFELDFSKIIMNLSIREP